MWHGRLSLIFCQVIKLWWATNSPLMYTLFPFKDANIVTEALVCYWGTQHLGQLDSGQRGVWRLQLWQKRYSPQIRGEYTRLLVEEEEEEEGEEGDYQSVQQRSRFSVHNGTVEVILKCTGWDKYETSCDKRKSTIDEWLQCDRWQRAMQRHERLATANRHRLSLPTGVTRHAPTNTHTHTHKRELVQWMQGSLYRHTVQCTLEHFLGPLVKATELAHRETRTEGIEAGPTESRQWVDQCWWSASRSGWPMRGDRSRRKYVHKRSLYCHCNELDSICTSEAFTLLTFQAPTPDDATESYKLIRNYRQNIFGK